MCLPCHIPSSEQRYLEAEDSILFSTEKFPNGTGCPKFQSSKVRNCNKLLIFLFLISSLRTLTKEKHLKITSHVLPNVIFRRLPSLSLTFFYLFSKFVWPSFLLFKYWTWQYFKNVQMFISAQNIAPFYVMKQTNNFFSMFLLLAFNFNCHYRCLVPSSSTIPVVEDKLL